MKLVRLSVFIAAAVLLGGGYLASQSAYIASLDQARRDATADYAAGLDASPVPYLALLVLLFCIVSAAMPQREAED